MGAKTNDETVKYKIIANLSVQGITSESDIVGALFGQTEGLLESDMELKQLQKSGRIGRIGLQISNKGGMTVGIITIPSSLNKIETAIIAATLESVDRVGPCTCKIILESIIDVRKSKRDAITKRAAEIMKKWDIDTQEEVGQIPALVEKNAKRGQIVIFGPDRLPAGPDIFHNQDIILVEGRADVINLLKMDIQNIIAIEGTKIPHTIKNLCKNRNVTALLDGDRGGDMILKELLLIASIDYVARAPLRKEVEDLKHEEVINVLESKVPVDQAKFLTEDTTVSQFLEENGKLKKKSFYNRTKHSSRTPKPIEPEKSASAIYKKQFNKDQKRSDRPSQSLQTRPSRKYPPNKSIDRSPKEDHADRNRKSHHQKDRRDRPQSNHSIQKRRSFKHQKVHFPKALISLIDGIKQTFNAVFVNSKYETMEKCTTAEAYDKLQGIDDVNSIIIDGVITQRIIDVAHQKSVQFIVGAMVGDLDRSKRYEFPQITTFNRI